MARKINVYFSLGPAALDILEMEKHINRKEASKRAADKRLRSKYADWAAEGDYEELEFGRYYHQAKNGTYYDITDAVNALEQVDDSEEFTDDDLAEFMDDALNDDGLDDSMDDIGEEYIEDEEDEYEHTTQELVADIVDKTLQYLAAYTPVDTGNLVDAIYSNQFNNGTAATVGFDMHKAPYAVYQHENTALAHPNGTAKFLEKAVEEASLTCDPEGLININIVIKGLNEGATLEAQINFVDNNLGSLLQEGGLTGKFDDLIEHSKNFDYAADMKDDMDLKEYVDAGLIDPQLLTDLMSNRRMNSKRLAKLKDKDLISSMFTSMDVGDINAATGSLALHMLKNRHNFTRTVAKMKHAAKFSYGNWGL